MKYWKCIASAEYVGTNETWKITSVSEKTASEEFRDTAIQHIESYDQGDEEEDGVEREYNYSVIEITKKEYDNLDVEELF